MSVKINYTDNKINQNSSNLILFTNEKFEVKHLRKFLSKNDFSYVNDLLKTSDLKKNLFIFEINSKKKNCTSIN